MALRAVRFWRSSLSTGCTKLSNSAGRSGTQSCRIGWKSQSHYLTRMPQKVRINGLLYSKCVITYNHYLYRIDVYWGYKPTDPFTIHLNFHTDKSATSAARPRTSQRQPEMVPPERVAVSGSNHWKSWWTFHQPALSKMFFHVSPLTKITCTFAGGICCIMQKRCNFDV